MSGNNEKIAKENVNVSLEIYTQAILQGSV